MSIPPNRCGYTIESGAIGPGRRRVGGSCCWRPAEEGRARCIWHADIDEKEATELLDQIDESANHLGGVIASSVSFPDSLTIAESTFQNADLSSAEFRDSILRNNLFAEADLSDADLSGTVLRRADFQESDLSNANLTGADLREANVANVLAPGINFSEADLRQADFSGGDLREVTLSNANLEAASFRNARLWEANLADADLTVVALEAADLQEADLKRARLSECALEDTSFRDADLSGAILQGAILTNARLQGATLTGSTLVRSKLANSFCRETDFTQADLRDVEAEHIYAPDASFERARLEGGTLYEAKAPNASFKGVTAPNIDLTNADLRSVDLSDADLAEGELSHADLTGADLSDADLSDANLTGVILDNADLSGANMEGVKLDDAELTEAMIRESHIRPTTAKGADFTEADLTGANLEAAIFDEATLREADLTDVTGTGANFVEADLESAVLDGCDFRRADFRRAQLHGAWLRDVRLDEKTQFGRMCYYEGESDRALEPDISGREQRLFGEEESQTKIGAARRLLGDVYPAVVRLANRIRPSHRLEDEIAELNDAIRVYRTYQRVFRENSLPGLSRRYYVRERHARRKIALSENEFTKWGKLSLQRWTMLYAEGAVHVILTSVFVIFAFAMLLPLFGLERVGEQEVSAPTSVTELVITGRDLLGYSLRNFLALSSPEFTAVGWAELLVMIEAFLGALLLALLVFVLGRRATR